MKQLMGSWELGMQAQIKSEEMYKWSNI
jgi:hypothetical protein